MITIEVIEYPGYDELKNNFNKYKEIFLDQSIIAFRNANLDFNAQEKIMHLFGDNLSWYPNSSNTNQSDYIEDHHKHMTEDNVLNKNSIMLEWHQEHIAKENNPYLSGVWNMTLFNCSPDSGKTYFVDMQKFYKNLFKEDKDFLSLCKAKIQIESQQFIYKLVSKHWLTSEDVLRTYYDDSEDIELFLINEQNPTIDEKNKFKQLSNYIKKEIQFNEEIRMQHIWQQGDLLIPDLFKLAHAVSGGFDKNQRRLEGMFGTLLPWEKRS